MARKTKKVNKNLVAVLTVSGMLLSTLVVGVGSYSLAAKDPEALAAKAAGLEQRGELDRASRMYVRAFNVDKEARYLLEAARCERNRGEFGDMFGLLNYAAAQAPDDGDVLERLLERYWELRQYGFRDWQIVRDRAEALLVQDPDNVLGLVCRAKALDALSQETPRLAEEADAAIARAMEVAPEDPRLALVRAQRILQQAAIEHEAGDRRYRREIEEKYAAARDQAEQIVRAGLENAPGDRELTILLSRIHTHAGKPEQARAVLEQATEDRPDDPTLWFELSRYLLNLAQEYRAERTRQEEPWETEEAKNLITSGLAAADQVIALEPGYYEIYLPRAVLQQLEWEHSGRWQRETIAAQSEILESFITALQDTLGVKSFRVELGAEARRQMIVGAFDLAMEYVARTQDPDVEENALQYAQRFIEEARSRSPGSVEVPFMEGQYAMARGLKREALRAFEEAERRPEAEQRPHLKLLAAEQLSLLYRELGSPGLALQYADEAIKEYREQSRQPSLRVILNKGHTLLELERPTEALDLADLQLGEYPGHPGLIRLRGAALTMLDRGAEAMEVFGQLEGQGSDRAQLDKALVAAHSGNDTEAEALLREVLANDPGNQVAIRLFVQVLARNDRRDEADALLAELEQRDMDAKTRKMIAAYRVALSTGDAAQRDAQLLELIEQTDDPGERAADMTNFWLSRGDYEKAAKYVDELEKLDPQSPTVLELQFRVAMQLEQWDKAESYVKRLASLNADDVGGSTYRGKLALRRGDPAAALKELRAAERTLSTDSALKVLIAQALLAYSPPRFEEAESTLRKAVEFDPRNFAANRLLYSVLERTGRRDEGVQYLEAAARENPNDSYVAEKMQLVEEEKDPASGIAQREAMRERNPEDLANLRRLVELYALQEDFETGRKRLEEALALAPTDPDTMRVAANFYSAARDREAAEALLRDYIAEAEGIERVRGFLVLARLYDRLEDAEAVESVLREAESRVDELVSDAEERRRSRIVINTALADHYRKQQQYAMGIDARRRVLGLLPEDETAARQDVRLQIAKSLLLAREYEEAEGEIRAYRQDFADDPRGMMAEADLLMRRGGMDRFERAKELLSHVLTLRPENAWSLFMRGKLNLEMRRLADARNDLLRAKELAPLDFNLEHRLELARLYEMTEQFALAESELRELLSLRRDDKQLVLRMLDLLERAGKDEAVVEFLDQVIARNPNDWFWPYHLGRVLSQREEYSAAARPLKRAVELTEGRNPAPIAEWIMALAKGKRAPEAVQAYEGLPEQFRGPVIRTAAAEAYHKTGDPARATELLEQGLAMASAASIQGARYVLSKAIELLGFNDGLRLADRVRERLSGASLVAEKRLRVTVGKFVVEADDAALVSQAETFAHQLIDEEMEKDADRDQMVLLEAMLVLARVHERRQDWEKAVELYEQMLEILPNNSQILNNLAYTLADKAGRAAEAEPYARRARELDSGNPNVLDTVGWVLAQAGKHDEAEATLLEAIRLDPDLLAARYHLGLVYKQSNRRAEAERTFTRLRDRAQDMNNTEYVSMANEQLRSLP